MRLHAVEALATFGGRSCGFAGGESTQVFRFLFVEKKVTVFQKIEPNFVHTWNLWPFGDPKLGPKRCVAAAGGVVCVCV